MVEVYWAGDGEWFLGRVAGQREGKLKIAYTDGEALYQVLQDEPFAGDGDCAPADGEPNTFASPRRRRRPAPRRPRPAQGRADDLQQARQARRHRRPRRSGDGPRQARAPRRLEQRRRRAGAGAGARGRRERKSPSAVAAACRRRVHAPAARSGREARRRRLAATHHELEFADGRKEHVKLSRRPPPSARRGAPWTFVERKERKAPAPKKPKAAPKRKAAARKPPAAKKAKTPADEAAAAPPRAAAAAAAARRPAAPRQTARQKRDGRPVVDGAHASAARASANQGRDL